LERLGRSTINMLGLSRELRGSGVNLRARNLGGGNVDTGTPMSSMAALAEMELEIKRERINDSVRQRRAACRDLGGRRQQFTKSQILNACRLVDGGEPGDQGRRIWAGHGQRFTGGSKSSTPHPQ
jgi:DNA invertase Pin-like site-specific DNA recombinase